MASMTPRPQSPPRNQRASLRRSSSTETLHVVRESVRFTSPLEPHHNTGRHRLKTSQDSVPGVFSALRKVETVAGDHELDASLKGNAGSRSLRLLNDNFFSTSLEELEALTPDSMAIAEPPQIKSKDNAPPPTIEIIRHQTWLTAGTPAQMIEFITGPTQNAEWVHTFLITHAYHSTTEQLLEALIEQFKTYPLKKTEVNLIHMRIVRIISRWKSLPCYDFASSSHQAHVIVQRFAKFLDESKVHPIASHWAKELQQTAGTFVPIRTLSEEGRPSGKKRKTMARMSLLRLDPYDVAKQLTLIDQEMICAIKLSELTKTRWSGGGKKEEAPNVLAFAKRFNVISSWVATEVLVAPSNDLRVEVLESLLRIELHLLEMNNFNSLMAIHAGLNFSEIARLKPLWKLASEKLIKRFEQVEETMSPLHNFSHYRKTLSETVPPFIPFQSRLLGDLMSAEQMDTFLDNGHVNFYKLSEIAQLLKLVELSQSVAYPFEPSAEIRNYLQDDLFVLSRSVMFSLSEQCLRGFEKPRKKKSPRRFL